MKKTEKIKKYLKDNPLADKKRIAKKFKLNHLVALDILAEINNESPDAIAKTKKENKFSFLADIFNNKVISNKNAYFFLFGLAGILRIFYALKLNTFPQLNIEILDAQYYVDWAKKINTYGVLGDKIFFTEPLYAYFLAMILKISTHGLILVRILQMILGSLLPIVIMKIGEKIFSRPIGFIAGIIVAVYAPFIFYENLILKTSLEIFSLAGFFWFFLFMLEKKSNKTYLIGGLLLGILSLIKGNNIIFFPAILLILYYSKKLITKEKRALSLFFALGFFLVISPITLRNYIVGKDFVPTNYSIGIVTYQGNWWGSDGSTAMVPSFFRPHPKYEETDAREMANAYAGKNLSPSKISSFWIGKAISESFSDPIRFLKNLFVKLLMLLNYHELSDDYSFDFYAKFIILLKVLPGFLIVSTLAITGMLLALFSNDLKWTISKKTNTSLQEISKKTKLLLSVIGVYVLVLLISNINSRYRMPLVPFLSIFSAVTIWHIWIKIKNKLWEFIPITSILITLSAGLSMFPLPIYGAINEDANAYHQIGSYYIENKDFERAKLYFEKTIEIDKNYAWAYKNLFLINMQKGDLKEAEKNIKEVIIIRSDDLSNYENLALLKNAQKELTTEIKDQINKSISDGTPNIYDTDSYEASRYLSAKDSKKAEQFLLKSLEKFNNPPNSLIALASVKRASNSNDEAIKYLSLAIEKNPYLLPARYNLANIYIEQKNYQLAIPQLKEIYDITPELGQTWSNLAIAYINTKNSAQASPVINDYIKRYQDDPTKKEMVDKFQKLISQSKTPTN
ncbi:MAG: tetratricopeptide repeat protein [bacterium]